MLKISEQLFKTAKHVKVLDRNLKYHIWEATYQNLLAMEMSNHMARQLAHENVSSFQFAQVFLNYFKVTQVQIQHRCSGRKIQHLFVKIIGAAVIECNTEYFEVLLVTFNLNILS